MDTKHNILIIDDDPSLRKTLSDILLAILDCKEGRNRV